MPLFKKFQKIFSSLCWVKKTMKIMNVIENNFIVNLISFVSNINLNLNFFEIM